MAIHAENFHDRKDTYRLRLDEAKIIFFPPQVRPGPPGKESTRLREAWVVQVMIKAAEQPPTREEVAAYCDAQGEITAAVESILIENIIEPLDREIEIEGDGYILRGKKKDWLWGRNLALEWGGEEVRTCADKWVFEFETTNE